LIPIHSIRTIGPSCHNCPSFRNCPSYLSSIR
jgi:hypothetical protein